MFITMALTNSLAATNFFIRHVFKTYSDCVVNLVRGFSKYFVPSIVADQKSENQLMSKTNQPTDPFEESRAGLPHLEAISSILKKPIQVYDENGILKLTVGIYSSESPIRVQYHRNAKHYTLLQNKEPFACAKHDMCLYNCLGDYTKTDPNILKSLTLDALRRGDVDMERFKGLDLCWGGATYTGNGPRAASTYLDNCQGKQGHGFPAPAHPRSHASNPGGVGVEAYSYGGRKTGFESYEDQDFVAHYALQNQKTRKCLNALNEGQTREVVNISGNELSLPRPVPGGTWINGNRTDSFTVATVTLVLQHFRGEHNNPDAPVFIQTMYPRYP